MEINVTETKYCELLVSCQASSEEISSKKEEVLSSFKKAPIPGFRKGKADKKAILVYYKKQIDDATKKALAEEAFHNTLFEKNIKPMGTPEFKEMFYFNNEFKCTFALLKKPDFDLMDLSNLTLIKKPSDKSVADFTQSMLEELRYKYGDTLPLTENDTIQSKDQVIINYQGYVDGEKLSNLAADGHLVTVGNSQIHQLDENLINMKVGETKQFTFQAPKNSLPSVADKSVVMEFTVLNGNRTNPLPLNDELGKRTGCETLSKLVEMLDGISNNKLKKEEKELMVQQLSNKLVDGHNFVVPDFLVLSEARYLVKKSNLNFDSLSEGDQKVYLAQAERNVKLSLVLDRYREVEPKAQLSDQEVLDQIKHFLSNMAPGQNLDLAMMQMNQNGYLAVLAARVRDEAALDCLMNSAQIVE